MSNMKENEIEEKKSKWGYASTLKDFERECRRIMEEAGYHGSTDDIWEMSLQALMYLGLVRQDELGYRGDLLPVKKITALIEGRVKWEMPGYCFVNPSGRMEDGRLVITKAIPWMLAKGFKKVLKDCQGCMTRNFKDDNGDTRDEAFCVNEKSGNIDWITCKERKCGKENQFEVWSRQINSYVIDGGLQSWMELGMYQTVIDFMRCVVNADYQYMMWVDNWFMELKENFETVCKFVKGEGKFHGIEWVMKEENDEDKDSDSNSNEDEKLMGMGIRDLRKLISTGKEEMNMKSKSKDKEKALDWFFSDWSSSSSSYSVYGRENNAWFFKMRPRENNPKEFYYDSVVGYRKLSKDEGLLGEVITVTTGLMTDVTEFVMDDEKREKYFVIIPKREDDIEEYIEGLRMLIDE